MDEAAKKLHNDLSRFANTLSGEHHVLKESLSKAAQELAEAFDVQPKASVGKIASVRKMQVQRAYYKKKMSELRKAAERCFRCQKSRCKRHFYLQIGTHFFF